MLLEIKRLTKTFGRVVAVRDLSFNVPAGCICAFVGPNGAGKTTTLRIAATVEIPDGGDVLIDGVSVVSEAYKVRQRFGFMPDYTVAPANLTVREYLDFFASAYRLRGRAKRKRLEEVIEFLNLSGLLDRPAAKLSRGMSQRVGLARTIIHDPDLLILDEPAAGLDPRARVELRELLKVLASQGKGVLVSSHVLTELSEIADKIVIIERGVLRVEGAIKEVMAMAQGPARLRVRLAGGPGDPLRFLAEQPHVQNVRRDGEGFLLDFAGSSEDQAALLSKLITSGYKVTEFHQEHGGLEELFLALTDGKVQ